MYYFLTHLKMQLYSNNNQLRILGLDEILEVSKIYYGALKDTARTLIKFDTNTLSQVYKW